GRRFGDIGSSYAWLLRPRGLAETGWWHDLHVGICRWSNRRICTPGSPMLTAGSVSAAALIGGRRPAIVRTVAARLRAMKQIIQPIAVSPTPPRIHKM